MDTYPLPYLYDPFYDLYDSYDNSLYGETAAAASAAGGGELSAYWGDYGDYVGASDMWVGTSVPYAAESATAETAETAAADSGLGTVSGVAVGASAGLEPAADPYPEYDVESGSYVYGGSGGCEEGEEGEQEEEPTAATGSVQPSVPQSEARTQPQQQPGQEQEPVLAVQRRRRLAARGTPGQRQQGQGRAGQEVQQAQVLQRRRLLQEGRRGPKPGGRGRVGCGLTPRSSGSLAVVRAIEALRGAVGVGWRHGAMVCVITVCGVMPANASRHVLTPPGHALLTTGPKPKPDRPIPPPFEPKPANVSRESTVRRPCGRRLFLWQASRSGWANQRNLTCQAMHGWWDSCVYATGCRPYPWFATSPETGCAWPATRIGVTCLHHMSLAQRGALRIVDCALCAYAMSSHICPDLNQTRRSGCRASCAYRPMQLVIHRWGSAAAHACFGGDCGKV